MKCAGQDCPCWRRSGTTTGGADTSSRGTAWQSVAVAEASPTKMLESGPVLIRRPIEPMS
jgi:hypothetical protein